MRATLAERQKALVAALTRRDLLPEGLAPLAGVDGGVTRGLQAYRLNAQALSAKALAATFPRLREAMGEDDFDAMAWAFWRAHPPLRGDLAVWGETLSDFLAAQPGMDPALCDGARLEWASLVAERAADAVLEVASLDLLASTDPQHLGLRMRPGLQLLAQQGVPWLVWRQGWRAASRALADGEAALMLALLQGRSLDAGLSEAVAVDADFDFSAWLQSALQEAWLQSAFVLDPEENR